MIFLPMRAKSGRTAFAQLPAICLCLLPLFGAGCGGGGSSALPTGIPIANIPNPNPGVAASNSTVTGSVTDINGSAIVGATVTLGNQTATTSQGGTYTIPNVTVPAYQASLITGVVATATVNGRAYSGQNTVEVLNGEPNTSNINIVLSDNASQASLSGTVRDNNGTPLAYSRVFLSSGPFSLNVGGQAFANFSSLTVYTDSRGNYAIGRIPTGNTYTAVASYPGHLNQTISNITLNSSKGGVNFSLPIAVNSPTLPAVSNFSAYGFTFPIAGSRATGTTPQATLAGQQAIKAWFLASRGLKQKHQTDPSRIWQRPTTLRSTANALIETDLFWDYVEYNNLLGYSIVRSDGNNTNFLDIATVRDPLADRFNDGDPALKPGTTYYYNLGRLDTINFPQGIDTSSSGPASITMQVMPLDTILVQQPAPNATVSATPTFVWNAVANATSYQVLVYDQFPAYQSDSLGVAPIWPASSGSPGTSVVSAPTTQTTYAGPTLRSGHTYYVVALAQFTPSTSTPAVAATVSISPIQAFTVQ